MIIQPHRLHRRRRERGVAALEFAIILPVILTLLLGIIMFGQLIRLHLVVFTAANDCSVAMSQGAYQTSGGPYAGSGESFDWDSAHAAARQILDQAGLSSANSDELPNSQTSPLGNTAVCDTRVFGPAVPRLWNWGAPSIQYQTFNPAQRYRAERWDLVGQ